MPQLQVLSLTAFIRSASSMQLQRNNSTPRRCSESFCANDVPYFSGQEGDLVEEEVFHHNLFDCLTWLDFRPIRNFLIPIVSQRYNSLL